MTAATEPVEKNYITRAGLDRLESELRHLLEVERPKVVEIVSWAASNGDRSENGDYIYGKRRLREIDRRLRFLTRRMDCALVVDPRLQQGNSQIFFGATVDYRRLDIDTQERITIVGVDEIEVHPFVGRADADLPKGESVESAPSTRVSWRSPIARALLKAHDGDEVTVHSPEGAFMVVIESVSYR